MLQSSTPLPTQTQTVVPSSYLILDVEPTLASPAVNVSTHGRGRELTGVVSPFFNGTDADIANGDLTHAVDGVNGLLCAICVARRGNTRYRGSDEKPFLNPAYVT